MKIALVGNGWGAQSALKGIENNNVFQIELLSDAESRFKNVTRITKISNISADCKLIICSGYTERIPLQFIHQYDIINIHYSLLPAYRGLHSTVWAILNNEEYLGLSIHKMNEFFDDGDIIYQYKIKNDFIKTSVNYIEHFNAHIESNIEAIIVKYLNKEIIPQKQDKCCASWVPRRKKSDCKIDFNNKIDYLKAFFRALVYPYPLPYIEFKDKLINITKVQFQVSKVKSRIGYIVNIDNDGIWVTCQDGYIIFQEMKEEETSVSVDKSQFKIGSKFY